MENLGTNVIDQSASGSPFVRPSPLPGLARQQVHSLESVVVLLEAEVARSRASERSQRRMAIFANVMAAIAAVMATIAAMPLIVQWLR